MNTEHTNQPKQAAEAAFEQWWQRHGLTDPMDDEDRQYATASSWARRGYLAAMQAQQVEPNINDPQYRIGYTNGWADFADAVKAASEIKAAKQQAEPVAWLYEAYLWSGGLASYAWREMLERERPNIGKNVRNITPLYAQPPAVAEGCGACGDGCKGQGCRLERESPPTCQTCNGQGMVGGLLPNGGGYDGQPCPDCSAPQAAVAAPLPPYNVFSDDDGDSWREHPADADFVEGLQLGEEFELLAGWRPVRVTFRVTKVPDDENDDYEVEEVTAPAAAQKGGEA